VKHRITQLIEELLQPAPTATLPVVRLVVCMALVVITAAATTVSSFPLEALYLLGAATLAEAFPVPLAIRPGATSFATVFIVSAGGLYSWQIGAIVGLASMLLVELKLRRPLAQMSFNAGLYTVAGAAAGFAAHLGPQWTLHGVLRGSAAFWMVDIGLLALLFSRLHGQSYLTLIRRFARDTWAPLAVMAALAVIFVQLWQDSPFWGLAIAPILFTISAFERSLLTAFKRQLELDKLKEEFVATVSHELRTPLASVYGGAMTLQRLGLDSPTAPAMVNLMAEQAERLSTLVDDVLWAAGRPNAKKEGRSYDAHQIARDAIDAVTLGPQQTVNEPKGDGGPCVGMPDNVRRILLNLVDNAVKYSPGGTIDVGFHREGGHAVWMVTDNGPGIDEHQRETVFEKFVRLDPDMSNGIGGTGLGLYISRELARAMGGELSCIDNPDGHGTRFVLELPELANVGGRLVPCAA
jgi:signal transduction histidine kinase